MIEEIYKVIVKNPYYSSIQFIREMEDNYGLEIYDYFSMDDYIVSITHSNINIIGFIEYYLSRNNEKIMFLEKCLKKDIKNERKIQN